MAAAKAMVRHRADSVPSILLCMLFFVGECSTNCFRGRFFHAALGLKQNCTGPSSDNLNGEIGHFAALSLPRGMPVVRRDPGGGGMVIVLKGVETPQRPRRFMARSLGPWLSRRTCSLRTLIHSWRHSRATCRSWFIQPATTIRRNWSRVVTGERPLKNPRGSIRQTASAKLPGSAGIPPETDGVPKCLEL